MFECGDGADIPLAPCGAAPAADKDVEGKRLGDVRGTTGRRNVGPISHAHKAVGRGPCMAAHDTGIIQLLGY